MVRAIDATDLRVVEPFFGLVVANELVDALAVDEGSPVDTVVGSLSGVDLDGGVVDVSVEAGPWLRTNS